MNPMMAVGAIVVVIIIVAAAAYVFTSSGKPLSPGYATTVAVSQTNYNTSSTSVSSVTGHPNIPANTTALTTTVSRKVYRFTAGFNTTYGNYLANATGFALYLYTPDKRYSNASACTGGCASFWPPFIVNGSYTLEAPAGVNISGFSTITRSDGSKQLEYEGWPLYYFAQDKTSGQITGNGDQGTFYIVTLPSPAVPPVSSGK